MSGWRGRPLEKATRSAGWRRPGPVKPAVAAPKGLTAPKPGQDQQRRATLAQRQWVPEQWDGYPHPEGAVVDYQRPDMAEPATGKITHRGPHGVWVERPDGRRHKVRWESIAGRGRVGVEEKEEDEAHRALRLMGVEIDPVASLLHHGEPQRADDETTEQLKLLLAAGAPVREDRIKTAAPEHLRALVDYLTAGRGVKQTA